MSFDALRWDLGRLLILDQRLLPAREEWLEARSWREVADAIRNMAVRGAPLIGIAASYGMALAQDAGDDLEEARQGLASTRPTAVNLFRALDRVRAADNVLDEARKIEAEERAANDRIGLNGAGLVIENSRILTVCNTGSLATAGIGTALGIIRAAHRLGKVREVYVCESRPRMQGLRLTCWELKRDGIPFRAIADGAAAWLMAARDSAPPGKRRGECDGGVLSFRGSVERGVDLVITGADRIAANGDTANKVGSYSLALIAKSHDIPFVVAAPSSSIDPDALSGEAIPIEERASDEITTIDGIRIAPESYPVWNPAFDITPGRLISHIVTDQGVYSPPYDFGGVFASSQS